MAEAFQDARHLLASGLRAPLRVDLRYFACSVRVFDNINLVLRIAHLATIRFSLHLRHSLASFFRPKCQTVVYNNISLATAPDVDPQLCG